MKMNTNVSFKKTALTGHLYICILRGQELQILETAHL